MARGGLALGAGVARLAVPPGATGRATPKPQVPRSVLVAYATGRQVAVYNGPAARAPLQTLSSPTDEGAMLSFLVRRVRPHSLEVLLPPRLHGARGWIRRPPVRACPDG